MTGTQAAGVTVKAQGGVKEEHVHVLQEMGLAPLQSPEQGDGRTGSHDMLHEGVFTTAMTGPCQGGQCWFWPSVLVFAFVPSRF